MNKPLVELVLPRLAKTLYRELQRFRAGKLNESQFASCFEKLLQNQHQWLMNRGVSDARAALAIQGATLVLSTPGLRAEASESGVPMEVIEFRAIREIAADLARCYEVSEKKVVDALTRIVARYGE
ncbi:MAG TPA: hypothetical protein VGY66_02165 [Gemmataceae bacterium]|jgi:hypothetical protein|nr:hypothetical protein [Gemmataceae bacterium]